MSVVSGEILLCDFGSTGKDQSKDNNQGSLTEKKSQKIMQFMDWADYSGK